MNTKDDGIFAAQVRTAVHQAIRLEVGGVIDVHGTAILVYDSPTHIADHVAATLTSQRTAENVLVKTVAPVRPAPMPQRKTWDADRHDRGDTNEADGYESSDYVDGWNEALTAVESGWEASHTEPQEAPGEVQQLSADRTELERLRTAIRGILAWPTLGQLRLNAVRQALQHLVGDE